ncbi:hypothetical protein GCM10010869_49460 [Mesorhizobium tianshanense]|nr:hypothetical protein GCM10010869_49460 [Mesorhizobium tianshanense]
MEGRWQTDLLQGAGDLVSHEGTYAMTKENKRPVAVPAERLSDHGYQYVHAADGDLR